MEFGVTMFPTDFSMGPAELAIAVEERGLDALFIPDHTHIPAGSDEAFRIADKMPPDYSHNLDMFIGLAAAAAVTKRIRLGTGICLVVERDPIVTAKEVARKSSKMESSQLQDTIRSSSPRLGQISSLKAVKIVNHSFQALMKTTSSEPPLSLASLSMSASHR